MRIAEIRWHRLVGATVDGGWPQGHEPEDDLHTLLEVVSDEGLTGWGSVYTSSALTAAGLEQLKPLWQDESALEPERVSEKLRQSSFWQGRGGTLEHVISGIDIALWDLFGKACGQPVARLLGGYYRTKIKPYGSLLFAEPGLLRDRLEETTARGFRAIKLGWRPFGRRNAKFDELLVRTARDTLGPDVDLLIDAGGSEQFWPHGYKWALRTAQMLAEYDVGWFEEALPPDDIEGFIRLRNAAPVPIAGGEVLTRRQSFLPWIERGALDIVQPDATKCGGLSEARRIAWLAHDHNIQVVSHGWNTAVGLAADLHLAAAIPVAKYVEYLTPAPYIDEILTTAFQLDGDGYLTIPEGPGLGIAVDAEALRRFGGSCA
jgi:L-alanine-DL-glutamate epimerase-like enolase superfamily enzyme